MRGEYCITVRVEYFLTLSHSLTLILSHPLTLILSLSKDGSQACLFKRLALKPCCHKTNRQTRARGRGSFASWAAVQAARPLAFLQA